MADEVTRRIATKEENLKLAEALADLGRTLGPTYKGMVIALFTEEPAFDGSGEKGIVGRVASIIRQDCTDQEKTEVAEAFLNKTVPMVAGWVKKFEKMVVVQPHENVVPLVREPPPDDEPPKAG